MEFKLFNKVSKAVLTKRFSVEDLLGKNIYYGGVFIGNGSDSYIFVQWIEDADENTRNPILNAVIPLV